ncbi:hypothetical protein PPYR_05011 [Photinus pyralis]|uniref:Medium-chain acyl-CoA ligase ACSF2, mitochondrial n=1 Tax=Photinus pyralis TaxID=7054 RepID=A0A5N4AZR0_PHOPY|nr:medium-chain acyl-CoA ligase ACSF2, mitochondrial-like [Photinus pyralis]KAB0802825.1 hypothetical protein PPYR_05011 [Photinus pyralis]
MNRIRSARFCSNLSYLHHIGKIPLEYIPYGKLLERTALRYPERAAVISLQDNKRITYQDLKTQADRFAAGLQQIGINYGDRVGLWAPNTIEWNVVSLACARGGFVVVPLNPAYTKPEIEYCINKVRLKTIICPERSSKQRFYATLCSIINNLDNQKPDNLINTTTPFLSSIITISENHLGGTFNYNDIMGLASETSVREINQHQVNPEGVANIQFTSGTTGKPKAAMISHFSIVNNSLAIGKRVELDEKHHKVCVQIPFFHGFGYTTSIGASVAYGATIVIPSPTYNSLQNLRAIKEENCTVVQGTPTMYIDLVNVQMQHNEKISLEIAMCGGAPSSSELYKKMKQHLNVKKITSVYGLSELTCVAFQSLSLDDEDKVLNTVGHVGDHLEVKVVDEKNEIVPIGTPGELCVRGYNTMLGYWEDKKKTDEVIDDGGWFKTGDKFILDKNGYGIFIGRLKDIIIRGGENIFPKEIEDFLYTHPDVLEIHVIGLAHERLGEEVCACVKVRDGAELTLDRIQEFCEGVLSKYKIPTQLRIVDKFPKTQSGKIQKFLLKRQFESDN